jgi:MFS family permease
MGRGGRLLLAGQLYTIVILFGLVSMLGDASYEGFRGALPALIPGTLELGGVAGLGEVIAWGLRPLTGYLAELLGAYWGFVILGYSLIPVGILVAGLGGPMLVLGYAVERLGKALRSPARDALLSSIAGGRRGLVFGVHEFLDQFGAILGPFIAMAAISLGSWWILALPGALTVPVLLAVKTIYPRDAVPAVRRVDIRSALRGSLGSVAYVLTAGTLAASPIAVAHAARVLGAVDAEGVMLLYAVAMLADAAAAIPVGLLYDRRPRLAALLPAVVGVAGGVMVLGSGHTKLLAYLAAAAAGIAEAGFETVARAMVKSGATGYGLYGLARGLALTGSILLYGTLAGWIAA